MNEKKIDRVRFAVEFRVFRILARFTNDMLVPEALPSELLIHAGAPETPSRDV